MSLFSLYCICLITHICLMCRADPIVHRLAEKINFVTINRLNGDLAVSRSIGDADYKNITPGEPVTLWFPWPDNHSQIFYADLVIPVPEFVVLPIVPTDEFVVLASDGLWDVISDDDVIQIARNKLAEGKSPSLVAEELCELALRLGSSDNVTIVIVQFSHTAASPGGGRLGSDSPYERDIRSSGTSSSLNRSGMPPPSGTRPINTQGLVAPQVGDNNLAGKRPVRTSYYQPDNSTNIGRPKPI